MGLRIQGVLVRARPDEAGLAQFGQAYPYRVFELSGRGLWLMDIGVEAPKPGDRATVRAARRLAPSYVDAMRVLGNDDDQFEQFAWLAASAVVAEKLRQPVLGFVSDDDQLDFATVITSAGVGVIDDRLGHYLLRWENGGLTIQPFLEGSEAELAVPPEELALIPAVTLLGPEKLTAGGYPLHGNVAAEMSSFSNGAAALGVGTTNYGRVGSLALIAARGLENSMWDRAVRGDHS